MYAIYRRRRTEYASKLLRDFGPVVVIAPGQVHTTDEEAMKLIYSRSSVKSAFYSGMGSWKGVTSTLGFLEYEKAAPARRNLLQCFQNKNLDTLAENISSHVDDFVRLLAKKASEDASVDGVVVFRLLALDVVTDVLWGEQNRLLSQAGEASAVFVRRFHAFSIYNALRAFIPGLDALVSCFGTRRWRQLRRDCNDIDITARAALSRWQANPHKHQKDVLSMLQHMRLSPDSPDGGGIPTAHLPAYMVESLAAGSSTTSHTAAFACRLLTQHPAAQRALRAELRAAFPDRDAALRETMRLHPAWRPERWLAAAGDDDGDGARMRLNWIPFGHGSRACPGANLAVIELKYILGAVFRKFTAVPVPGREADGGVIELDDVFAASTRSGQCWLKFEVAGD
ncbi:hypothetical protein GTA08_BOTSDO07506 [Neofusicoccum parvum]|uniref:Uncharacterized protein n=1 Tax=Neofusicoccum parvum TaxID=310453 RepID=A0ACB5S4P4_9PEZI|nr:hypothetical protein GTA08_BOTSDO07506 [Neofusicoccum parvum]